MTFLMSVQVFESLIISYGATTDIYYDEDKEDGHKLLRYVNYK